MAAQHKKQKGNGCQRSVRKNSWPATVRKKQRGCGNVAAVSGASHKRSLESHRHRNPSHNRRGCFTTAGSSILPIEPVFCPGLANAYINTKDMMLAYY